MIPITDLKAQYQEIKEEINNAVLGVLARGEFILGPEVRSFEEEMASYLNVPYTVGVASGTDALILALLACGVKPGDEVITTPFTFIATAEAVVRCGAVPVFVDIDPVSCNIDSEKIESKVTTRTKVILPVHLYGQPADMQAVGEIARKYNLMVVEDCAQSLGAEYMGRKTGSIGSAGCFSFFPSKILGAYGDGGLIATNDKQVAERVKMLRNHGCAEKYYHLTHGFNSRLDNIQAAVLRVKLKYMDAWIRTRQKVAEIYRQHLKDVEGVLLPVATTDRTHVYNYYTIRVTSREKDRSQLQQQLRSEGVASAVYYPLSLHLQEVYRYLGYKKGDFPESEGAQAEVLSLPIYPELSEKEIVKISKIIKKFLIKYGGN